MSYEIAQAEKKVKSKTSSARSVLQRECDMCSKKTPSLDRSAAHTGSGSVPPTVHEVLRSPGQPLDPSTRAFMEPRFGHDFSRVRVHSGKDAEQSAWDLNARAYTSRNDIVFGAHRFDPGTGEGKRLIAHELTHVLQARAADTGRGEMSQSGSASHVSRDVSESQAARMASAVLTTGRVNEAPLPATGIHLDKESEEATKIEAEILEVLNVSVGAEDTAAQRRRIDRLAAIFANLPYTTAGQLAARLEKPAASDKLARTFHYRLSTEARDVLIGRLRARAASFMSLYSKYDDPRKDPNYIENVIDEVDCMLIYADRYILIWKGGRKVVFNADIDWTKTSTTMPILDLHNDEASAKAKAAEWQDVAVASNHDRAVAFYRGQGGAILPTWFSPETTPVTYDLIIGVNGQVRREAAAAASFFKDMRNSIAVGIVLGGALKFFIRILPGGGGIRGPKISGGDVDVPGGRTTTVDPNAPKPPTTIKAPNVVDEPITVKPSVTDEPGAGKSPSGTGPRLTIRERLTRFYERLSAKPHAANADEGLKQVNDTLDQVEDEFSGVVKKNPPPPPKENDGRMYPPMSDNITRNPDGSITAKTRGHRINIGPNGSITITNSKTGQVEFEKP